MTTGNEHKGRQGEPRGNITEARNHCGESAHLGEWAPNLTSSQFTLGRTAHALLHQGCLHCFVLPSVLLSKLLCNNFLLGYLSFHQDLVRDLCRFPGPLVEHRHCTLYTAGACARWSMPLFACFDAPVGKVQEAAQSHDGRVELRLVKPLAIQR
jgi:hypothetical protein